MPLQMLKNYTNNDHQDVDFPIGEKNFLNKLTKNGIEVHFVDFLLMIFS